MTNPLNSIQNVDNEMHEFIAQIEKGNAPNPNKLLHIEEELKSLVKNKNIPDSVKQGLQNALQKLSTEETPDIYGAKTQIDQALEEGQKQNQQ